MAFKKKWIVDLPPELWYKLENMKSGRTREELLKDLLKAVDKDTWKLIEEIRVLEEENRALKERVAVLNERIRALEAEIGKLRERSTHAKVVR